MNAPENSVCVLVVEDDFASRKLFAAILETRGNFRVRLSEDPMEILNMARQKQIQIIVMDVALTNSTYQGEPIDGLKISKMLKEDPETREIPIILATAHAMQGQGDHFLRVSEADDYLPKPIVDPDVLVKKIKALVKKLGP